MRQIAFKLAKDCHLVKDSLPDNYVVEWTYVDLHPNGLEGEWQFANESQFQAIMQVNNTDQKLKEHKDKMDADKVAKDLEDLQKWEVEKAARDAEKEANAALFEEFIKWKKDKGL